MSQPDRPAALPVAPQPLPGDPPACVAVLLAAGAGRRMGGVPKSLLLRDGQTLLARQIRLLAGAGAARIAVALGHHAGRLQPVLQDVRAELQGRSAGAVQLAWAINPAPDAGPGSSLRCALALLPEAPTVLVALADQPLLELADVQAVLQAWQQRGPGIELLVPVHQGQPGHPIALGPALRAAVMQMPGGQGVREWRRAHAQQVQTLAARHARHCTDVDTPQDVQRLQREWGVALALPADFPFSCEGG
ncbi:hypothetical protein GCM10027019_26160 [Melaminivora jejuensis]|uniref:nucleotidyltransferase family protein n=1 Tax=Melaminivora jejuensis TaxID=1267217 RepID=UPI001E37E13E|nr:nucleotidyltransferase family protein [Melaminivora jejuensis]UHJ66326.1 nucleotidyltransferase family protein [Melaminivora jejuensis]